MRCTQKAACGHRRSHVISGATGKAVHTEGGAYTRRCTQKAACGLLSVGGRFQVQKLSFDLTTSTPRTSFFAICLMGRRG